MMNSLKWAMIGTLLSATVVAQQNPAPKLSSTQSLLNGRAVDANQKPLADATIRLRNLQTKQIEQVTVSDNKGEFSFVVRPDTPYVAEIADQTGRTLAAGDVVNAQAGDAAATLVALPAKLPASGAIFGDTAASVMAAVTGIGVTVLQTGVLPVASPEK
ncbi:MAG: hypothetical protein ND807_12450 [Vicinamibacterales bacterium]|nr:hypothetical protein [Vicinamibacterales bacterium]